MKIPVAEKDMLDKNGADIHPTEKKIPVDKSTIAWFKLAEFVGRKEKERALSVYRLLSHSLSDHAFAAQLEGDLLMAFYDDKAFESYQKAAWLYEKNGQFEHAAFLNVKIAQYAQLKRNEEVAAHNTF